MSGVGVGDIGMNPLITDVRRLDHAFVLARGKGLRQTIIGGAWWIFALGYCRFGLAGLGARRGDEVRRPHGEHEERQRYPNSPSAEPFQGGFSQSFP
jgi:hypothetical protein